MKRLTMVLALLLASAGTAFADCGSCDGKKPADNRIEEPQQ